MDLSSQIIPAIIILIANLLSGKHSSYHWEYVTAIFGWGACISFVSFTILALFSNETPALEYILQVGTFCLITALARDYEKLFKIIFHRPN